MPTFKTTVMISDTPWNRAVKVTITGDDVSGFREGSDEVQKLAERAWRSPAKKIAVGKNVVKVEAFKR